jgi:hypothetical protein
LGNLKERAPAQISEERLVAAQQLDSSCIHGSFMSEAGIQPD